MIPSHVLSGFLGPVSIKSSGYGHETRSSYSSGSDTRQHRAVHKIRGAAPLSRCQSKGLSAQTDTASSGMMTLAWSAASLQFAPRGVAVGLGCLVARTLSRSPRCRVATIFPLASTKLPLKLASFLRPANLSHCRPLFFVGEPRFSALESGR